VPLTGGCSGSSEDGVYDCKGACALVGVSNGGGRS
jgi:hypothetical protein